MNSIALNIKNRLSLRPPQAISLEMLEKLCDTLELKKDIDIHRELEKVRSLYPTCADFERSFPSVCFALATGVGKTRLMGAFVAYLYLSKKIKNFFVLAPNLTIYNKLIEDFSNPTSPKYVFKGIGDFAQKPPKIVTGDNYDFQPDLDYYSDVRINVFNISKINAETKGGKLPRIKRLAECIGDSYFNYLASLNDLVVIMDESHHYRADRGMTVINELTPILGLELTATPQVEKSSGAVKFKNVAYEYSLAKAIKDGFVKKPAVATRKDFDPSKYDIEDLDRIKLEDGIRIHEDTKVALDIYAKDNNTRFVKPFVLVVAKDTTHSAALINMIKMKSFFGGYYADKVMEIHSNQTGGEKDENIEKLLTLESPDNKIEIVVHVNMLKEGWDVTNLYTIIPLRTATSMTLREQTIGRGLRLPYGRIMGVDKVDKLTIVAHDKFQAIIEEANKPDSIIQKENIIEIDPTALASRKEVITSRSNTETKIEEQEKAVQEITEPDKKHQAQISLEVQKAFSQVIPTLNNTAKTISDLKSPEIKKIVLERVKENIQFTSPLFSEEYIKEAESVYEPTINDYITSIIEIPRISIMQKGEILSGFNDFDLDTKNLNYQPLANEIFRKNLQDGVTDTINREGGIILDTPINRIVNELYNYPEIDYASCSDLLFKLSGQAIDKFKTYLDEEGIDRVAEDHKRDIGKFIYTQMMEHFYSKCTGFEETKVAPFTKIEEHNFSKECSDKLHHYTETITPVSSIPSKVFTGFKKACHSMYKFDSKTEKDFSIILDGDSAVLKWLRPAEKQFNLWYCKRQKRYTPDFVVETKDTIYLVETKKALDVGSQEVQDRAKSAIEYCRLASDYNKTTGGKPWEYLLIPHNAVMLNMSFAELVKISQKILEL